MDLNLSQLATLGIIENTLNANAPQSVSYQVFITISKLGERRIMASYESLLHGAGAIELSIIEPEFGIDNALIAAQNKADSMIRQMNEEQARVLDWAKEKGYLDEDE